MFDTASIRVLGLAGHFRPSRSETSSDKIVRFEEAEQEVESQTKRSARDVGWRHPEWWEYHNYERR